MSEELRQRLETGAWAVCTEPRTFPCDGGGTCPYEYGAQKPERNVEGMPFIDWDSRSCPTYGHVCPAFMEELGFIPEDLEIRAVLHCGLVLDRMPELRSRAKNDARILDQYKATQARYPVQKYPQYYV